jgi:hypothetical protein
MAHSPKAVADFAFAAINTLNHMCAISYASTPPLFAFILKICFFFGMGCSISFYGFAQRLTTA